jgi:hypothetical protein
VAELEAEVVAGRYSLADAKCYAARRDTLHRNKVGSQRWRHLACAALRDKAWLIFLARKALKWIMSSRPGLVLVPGLNMSVNDVVIRPDCDIPMPCVCSSVSCA